MGFWSINPYVGCAFGCAYCYARYAHRWVLDRHATANPEHDDMQSARDDCPPWLAFERRIFVKQNAADVLRKCCVTDRSKHLALLAGRDDRDRHGHRSVSTGRATVSHHALGARGARRASGTFDLHHHEESVDHARHRRAQAHQSAFVAVDSPVADLARPRPGAHASSRARRHPKRVCARWRGCARTTSRPAST